MEDYSINTGEIRSLGIVDYVLFVLMFVASASIGFYHAWKGRHHTNVKDFHLSGRKMHPIPVSMSLAATFLSALTLLGNPTEIYTHGTMFYWIVAAMLIATIASAHLFIPVFYNMEATSCFEYIQLRFGKATRTLASAVFVVQTLLFLGFVLYAPCLAFQAVTGLSLWATMISVAFVCTLYTTLGGMKTVLWTDSLQLTIMIAGLVAVLVESSRIAGGFGKAWEVAAENQRIEFFNVNPDPRTRHSVWSMVIGCGLSWTYLYGVNQAQVQRACSLPSLKKAQLAIWMNFPALVTIITLTCMIGITMFSFYKDCDPVKFGLINKADQMLPLMVLDILGNIPGLTGLFVACVFSGSLSSISSGLNAMSAVLLEDFFKPFCMRTLHGKKEILMSKVFVMFLGVLQFGVALAISQASGLILQLSYSVFSIMSGPLMGLFISGLVFPWTNKCGAISGLLTSLGIMCWLVLGAALESPSPMRAALPVSTKNCNWGIYNTTEVHNSSYLATTTLQTSTYTFTNVTVPDIEDEPLVYNFYRMSYQWYTGFGLLVNVVVSLTVSFITGRTDPKTLDSNLMVPLFYKLFPCLPEKIRKHLLFGVVYDKPAVQGNGFKLKSFDNIGFSKDSAKL